MKKKKQIVEKRIGIPADYQHKAIEKGNFIQSNWHSNKFIAIKKIVRLNKKLQLLDLGCGSGNFESIFASKVGHITALDYNDEAVNYTKVRLKNAGIKNVKVVEGDIKQLAKTKWSRKYDYILMVDVIEHIKIEDAKKMLTSFRKILKANGKVCIITPNYKSMWSIIERLLDKVNIVPKFDGEQHLARYDYEVLSKLFTDSGFDIVSTSSFNLFSYFLPNKSIAGKLTEWELNNLGSLGNLIIGIYQLKQKNS